MRAGQRGEYRLPRMAAARGAILAGLALLATACAAPPPPAAERPRATRPEPSPLQCGLVKRAPRTWVGFAKGMTAEHMVPAGIAAAQVVRAVDVAVCGVVRRGLHVPALEHCGPQLMAAVGFEVTKIWWEDLAMSHARVELLDAAASDRWLANVVRYGETWKVAEFSQHLAE